MEDEKLTRERRTIIHPAAARVLTDISERRFLDPFIKRESSLSDAAKELGIKLNTMHYRVKRFMALGLVSVVREELRKGKRIKIYRASADEFFVPFKVTPYTSLKILLDQLGALDQFVQNAADTLARQGGTWGVLVAGDKEDGVRVKLSPIDNKGIPTPISLVAWLDKTHPALWESEKILRLDFETAKMLQNELYELLQKYQQKGKTAGQAYFLLLGLTPLKEENL